MSMIPSSPRQANEALRSAIDAAGGQSSLAKICGCTQGAISKRLNAGKALWAEHVLKVEQITGISRHDLRPDLYPREEPPAQPSAGDPPPPAGGSAAPPRNSVGEVLA